MKTGHWRVFADAVWSLLRRTRIGYGLWAIRRWRLPLRPPSRPSGAKPCAVLRAREEVVDAQAKVKQLGLPPLGMPEKYWDALAAIQVVLNTTTPGDRILDAGAERWSPVLPWLARYGYRHLLGCNLVFGEPEKVGPIVYEHADITRTHYRSAQFAAVTCMSVLEHGVDTRWFFTEMNRIIRPGGHLVLSTDYWETPIDLDGVRLFDLPLRIFTPAQITDLIAEAENAGFELLAPIDLTCRERVVEFDGRGYTFLVLSFRCTAQGKSLG
jgi:SAM-dependent methyltransferase